MNVKCMLEVVANHALFHTEDRNAGLCNPFENISATGEQSHDMLNFRQIGQAGVYQAFECAKYSCTSAVHIFLISGSETASKGGR